MKGDSNCTLCPLHETAQFVCLLGSGPQPCEAMIVGEAPGKREDDSGKPFVGRSGQLLDEMMQSVGLNRSKIYITNAVHCRPPGNRTPKKREIDACKHWLMREIKAVKPKYLMVMGAVPLYAVLGLKGISKLRGRPIEHEGMVVLPTHHPSYILRSEGRDRAVAEQDLRTFKDIIEFGGIPEERALNFTVVNTWTQVDDMIDALEGVVSIDIETTGLYPWDEGARVVTVGFGTRKGEFNLPLHHRESNWTVAEVANILERVTDKLGDCISVYQNGRFDVLWMKVHYGVDWRIDFDTMLAHYMVDENSNHGLELLAKMYFGAHDWDIPLSEKKGDAPFARIAKYHAHDLFYTRKLYFKLKKQLAADAGVERVFNKILMPATNLFVKMEHHGCYIDVPNMDKAETYLRGEMASALERLNKWGEINWASTQQVGQLLYGKLKIKCLMKTKKGANSTSESALNLIEHACVKDLLKFRAAKQQLSFFIDGWKPFLDNSRIHPSFKLHGTVTGRLSSERPNFQQVPRDTRIRSLITAAPGWTLVEADLSQIEMRIAAELSHDPELRYCFNKGIDVHWRTMIHSINSDAGGYTDDIIQTAKLYCLRHGLPADGPSSEILLALWQTVEGGEEPEKLLQLCSDEWENKKSRSGTGRSSRERSQSVLERWLPNLASKEIPKELLSKVQRYFEYRFTSQGRESSQLEKIQLDNALSLLSRIGPSIASELSPVWKEGRKKAKAVGFGFLFGMWHKKFQIYARDNYDIHLTENEARRHRQDFFTLYKLEPWHRRQQNFAREHGYVRSMAGRKRRLPDAMAIEDTYERAEAWRQSINSPVQSFASDLNLMTLMQMADEFPWSVFRPVSTVHDAILAEVRNDHVEKVVQRIEEIMRGPAMLKEFNIKLSVPICGETKIGPWGKGVSLERWRKQQ